jgi:predicted nucleic acid-binding protein
MAVTHLLDTSVLTRLARPHVRDVVQPLAAVGQAARSGISHLEIGFSARNAEECLGSPAVAGLVQPAGTHDPDLLVAAAAEDAGLMVLHYDSDFDLIAAATGQPTEWVVPAGSID